MVVFLPLLHCIWTLLDYPCTALWKLCM